jgi:hypothetical protein
MGPPRQQVDNASDLLFELTGRGTIAVRHVIAVNGAPDLEHLQMTLRIIT